ncbi:Fe-S cluster assembly protein dre2 [Saccharata proteae CBS 121410]|uniref:Fe-S cluster assembly protein dre2 n=1 Tax=Saccharata proteae CBS 121410 TaxID=1314787 RepID=A0A9P4HS25_9PEZI|nr:Fe-S cluster assembly protein dre2 [Saccharata proteae CBS 121410]
MAPSVIIDNDSDFAPVPTKPALAARTLLVAPPSVAAHPEALDRIFEAHDRSATDIQMLDRLTMGLVALPASTYELVLLLTDADGTRREGRQLLGRGVINKLVHALKPAGRLRSQGGLFGADGAEKTEAILAGLVDDGPDGMVKPDHGVEQSVPLRLGRKANAAAKPPVDAVTLPINGKRKSISSQPTKPAGVGFVDFSDDFGVPLVDGEEEYDDDELIDENDLLTAEDKQRPVMPPPECRPKTGKRRRACKDCTCGLAQQIEKEDAEKRAAADGALNTMKLGEDDLAEVDFTVQGKVGSCGNCALGDAFRCDGCPYIGLPAFKPGEEVRLFNNDVQL